MPPGVTPLLLFRTMARSPRVFGKMFAGGLFEEGPLSLRQREIVIDRTTARLGCEYEWGVHVALFAERVGFGEAESTALVHGARPMPPAGQSTSRRCSRWSTTWSTGARISDGDLEHARGAFRRGADPRGDRAGGLLPHDQLSLRRSGSAA